MQVGEHFRITGGALKNWAIAQAQDSLAVAALWLVGLLILHVPWAPFWAVLAAILQFVPHLGAVLGMVFSYNRISCGAQRRYRSWLPSSRP